MSGKPLFCRRFNANKGRKAGCYQHADLPNHNPNARRFEAMTVDSQYGDSSPEIKQNKCEHWQSLGSLAARLVEKAKREREK